MQIDGDHKNHTGSIQDFLPLTSGKWSYAKVLEQLAFWQSATTHRDEYGRPVMRLLFRTLGQRLSLSKATLSRAIKYLAQQGIILARKVKVGAAYRWEVRVLIRPRETAPETAPETAVKRQRNGDETAINTTNTDNTPEYLDRADARSGGLVSEMAYGGFRGNTSDASDRLKDQKKALAEKTADRPPTPTEACHIWNGILRRNEDPPFPVDVKSKANVKRTLDKMGCKTTKEFRERIENAVDTYYSWRTQLKLQGKPAYPWFINKHFDLVFGNNAPKQLEPEEQTAKVDLVEKKPKGGGLMHLFSKAQKHYKTDTSSN